MESQYWCHFVGDTCDVGDAAGDENESMERGGMRRQLDGMGGVGGASSTPTVAELTYRGAHIARSSYIA